MTGGRIDTGRAFLPLNIAVLTVSDSRDETNDAAGDLLVQRLSDAGHALCGRALVRHDADAIESYAAAWIADPGIDVIISNGGTGLGESDRSPELWRRHFEREFEGFTVLWHLISYEAVGVSTMQSRACAGLVNGTAVYVLPGSPSACAEGWDRLISLQLDARHRPCSLIPLLKSRMNHA